MVDLQHDVLDNIVWNALTGPWSGLATRHGGAARFDADVSPFVGVQSQSPESWADVAQLVGAGGSGVLAGGPQTLPVGWTESFRIPGQQFVGVDVEPPNDRNREIVRLGGVDVDDMLELTARIQPGPFERRTVEFGGYLGIRREGRLVAMAGERMRVPGWTEISAVCTAEEVRGQGLAAQLVLEVCRNIRQRGDEPMLHVAQSNVRAIRLYEKLGFQMRRPIDFVRFEAPLSD